MRRRGFDHTSAAGWRSGEEGAGEWDEATTEILSCAQNDASIRRMESWVAALESLYDYGGGDAGGSCGVFA
jgi:hypothetical protein